MINSQAFTGDFGTQKFPYNGYLLIKLTFDFSVVGQSETFETLVVVCPCPPGVKKNSLLLGMNMDLVRRLLTPLAARSDMTLKSVHPKLHQEYQRIVKGQKAQPKQ